MRKEHYKKPWPDLSTRPGSAPGAALQSNLEAQAVLREIAGSSAQLRTNVSIGPIMSMEDTLGLTGSAIRAAIDWTGVGDAGRINFNGVTADPAATPTDLLALFRSVPFDGRVQEYLQRTGGVVDAGIQVEGAIKTEAALNYDPKTIQAVTLASWTKVERQRIDDIDGLLNDIGVALRTGVLTKLEDVLLNGAPGVPGILTSTGLVIPTFTAGTGIADAVSIALAQLRAAGVRPNFVALDPRTYAEEERRVGGDGQLAEVLRDGRMWNTPVVQSVAVPQGEALWVTRRSARRSA